MKPVSSLCTDVDSTACPCALTAINACPECSQLRGNILCDCEWTGLCVMDNYQWQDGMVEVSLEPGEDFRLLKSFALSQDTYLAYFLIAGAVSSFRFMDAVRLVSHRPPDYVEIPATILGVHEKAGILMVALNPRSWKEINHILSPSRPRLVMAGQPAILGLNHLLGLKNSTIHIASAGFGNLLLPFLAKSLQEQNNLVSYEARNLNPYLKDYLRYLGLPEKSPNRSLNWLVFLGGAAERTQLKQNRGGKAPGVAVLNHNLFTGRWR